MLEYTQGADLRLPVILQSSSGTAVPGVLVASVAMTVVKADGAAFDVSLTSSDWVEFTGSAYINQGYYNVLIPSSYANVPGVFQYCARVANANTYFGVVKIAAGDTTAIFNRLGVPAYGTIKDDIANVGITAGAGGFTAADRNALSSTLHIVSTLPEDPASTSGIVNVITQSFWTNDRNNLLSIKAQTDRLPSDPVSTAVMVAGLTGVITAENTNLTSQFTSIKGQGWVGTETIHNIYGAVAFTSASGALQSTLTSSISGVLITLTGSGYANGADSLHAISVAIQGITPGSGGGGFSSADRAALYAAYSSTLPLPADPASFSALSGVIDDARGHVMGSGTYGAGTGSTIYQVGQDTANIKTRTNYIPYSTVASSADVNNARDYLAGPAYTVSASLSALSSSMSASQFSLADRTMIQNISGTTNLILNDAIGIKFKTDNLPAYPANQTTIDTQFQYISGNLAASGGFSTADRDAISAIKSSTDRLPTNPADANTTFGSADRVQLTAVWGKTTNLPTDPASNTGLLNITGLASTNNGPTLKDMILNVSSTVHTLGLDASSNVSSLSGTIHAAELEISGTVHASVLETSGTIHDVELATSGTIHNSELATSGTIHAVDNVVSNSGFTSTDRSTLSGIASSAGSAATAAANAETAALASISAVNNVVNVIGTPFSGTVAAALTATYKQAVIGAENGGGGTVTVDLTPVLNKQNQTLDILGVPVNNLSRDIYEIARLVKNKK